MKYLREHERYINRKAAEFMQAHLDRVSIERRKAKLSDQRKWLWHPDAGWCDAVDYAIHNQQEKP